VSAASDCPLCRPEAHEATTTRVAGHAQLRVVRVLDAPGFPAYYRVIWNDHVAELTDLGASDRARCLDAVCTVERVLRNGASPTKVNLASLGNVVPHLHWHVIARFDWDSHFPQPIWGTAQRPPDLARLAALNGALIRIDDAIGKALA
jgi:diadenosine tetraphosphate (Ap4A) HIT family hydrolase